MSPDGLATLRADVRLDARPRPRPLGRPDRDRVLPRPRRRFDRAIVVVRRGIRRPERARLRRARRRAIGPHRGPWIGTPPASAGSSTARTANSDAQGHYGVSSRIETVPFACAKRLVWLADVASSDAGADGCASRRRAPTKCSPDDPPPRTTTTDQARSFAFRNALATVAAICLSTSTALFIATIAGRRQLRRDGVDRARERRAGRRRDATSSRSARRSGSRSRASGR